MKRISFTSFILGIQPSFGYRLFKRVNAGFLLPINELPNSMLHSCIHILITMCKLLECLHICCVNIYTNIYIYVRSPMFAHARASVPSPLFLSLFLCMSVHVCVCLGQEGPSRGENEAEIFITAILGEDIFAF